MTKGYVFRLSRTVKQRHGLVAYSVKDTLDHSTGWDGMING